MKKLLLICMTAFAVLTLTTSCLRDIVYGTSILGTWQMEYGSVLDEGKWTDATQEQMEDFGLVYSFNAGKLTIDGRGYSSYRVESDIIILGNGRMLKIIDVNATRLTLGYPINSVEEKYTFKRI